MACGAEQLGVGQRFAPAGTGAPASRAGGPAYLQDLTAGGSSQLEGDEDVGAEHVQHLHAGEDGGESVGQGQGVEGDAAQPGQHGQQRGGEQPGLPGPHQQGAEDADADLTCGGSTASRVGPAQPRPQHGHLTAGHGPAAPNEGGGFGGAPGEGTLSHRRDSNAPGPPEQCSGGAQPFPCKPWGMWGQGKALGLLGSPPLMPGMRSMVGNAARGPRKAQSPRCQRPESFAAFHFSLWGERSGPENLQEFPASSPALQPLPTLLVLPSPRQGHGRGGGRDAQWEPPHPAHLRGRWRSGQTLPRRCTRHPGTHAAAHGGRNHCTERG